MGSQYQSFPDARGASQTIAKLKSLLLPELRGKAFLDVGCNEGFFCAIARGAGAARVVGIDAKAEVLERARRRFEGIEFRHQSWDDPIEGRFDAVLCASAIHYAKDQPALIHKLVGLLGADGVLVLELGIAAQPGDRYVTIQRPAGGSCDFATPDTLRRVLAAYDVREIGPSVTQRGDPVPRFVLHIRRRRAPGAQNSAAPHIVLFDAASRWAKSATVQALVRAAPKGIARALPIDGVLVRITRRDFTPEPAHAAVHRTIVEFRRKRSPRTDLLLPMLYEQGLFEDFLALVESVAGAGTVPVTLWDGYLPAATREITRLYFERRGYRVWDAVPRQRFNVSVIDTASLRRKPDAPPDTSRAREHRPFRLAQLKSLQLPPLQGKTLLALGPAAESLCRLVARGGVAGAMTADPGAASVAHFDAILLQADAADPNAAIDRARGLLARLAPDGLLAIVFAPADRAASALARLRILAGSDQQPGENDLGSLLRRELPDCVVRKVTTGKIPARTPVAQVFHIEHARPVLVLAEDVAASESPELLAMLAAGNGPILSATELAARLDSGTPLPRTPLVPCAGALPPERRESLLQALVDSGFVVWELRERAPFPFAPLAVDQALQAVFPGATIDALAEAEQHHAEPGRASAWQRVRKLARGALRRLRGSAPAAPGSTERPVAATAPASKQAVPAPIEGQLQGARLTADGLELRGWAVDLASRRAIPDFVVELDGAPVTGLRLVRVQRPAISARYGMPQRGRPGFRLAIALTQGAPVQADRIRVGCRLRSSGEVYWLPAAPGLGLSPAGRPDADAGC